jgi:hypothetical protein
MTLLEWFAAGAGTAVAVIGLLELARWIDRHRDRYDK